MYSCGPLSGAQRPSRRWSGLSGLVGRTGCCDGRTRAPRAAASCSRWIGTGNAANTPSSIPNSASSPGLTRTAAAGAGWMIGGAANLPRDLELLPVGWRPLLVPPRLAVPRARELDIPPRVGCTEEARRGSSATAAGSGLGGAERRRWYSASSS